MLDLMNTRPSLSRAARAAKQAFKALEQGDDEVAMAFMKSLISDVRLMKGTLDTLEAEHAR